MLSAVASSKRRALSAPTAPSSVGIFAGDASVVVVWTDTSTNESGFQIEINDIDSGWVSVPTVGINVTEKDIFNLTNDVTYVARVRSYNVAGESSWTYSNSASPSSGITPVQNVDSSYFYATPSGTDAINLTWFAAALASFYEIDYSLDNNNWLGHTMPSQTTQSVYGLQSGTTYYFRIRAHRYGHAPSAWAYANATTE